MGRSVAEERIEILLSEAEDQYRQGNEDLAAHYIEILENIKLKAQIHLDKSNKKRYCEKCKVPLIPGTNCKIRLEKGNKKHICEERGSETVLKLED